MIYKTDSNSFSAIGRRLVFMRNAQGDLIVYVTWDSEEQLSDAALLMYATNTDLTIVDDMPLSLLLIDDREEGSSSEHWKMMTDVARVLTGMASGNEELTCYEVGDWGDGEVDFLPIEAAIYPIRPGSSETMCVLGTIDFVGRG